MKPSFLSRKILAMNVALRATTNNEAQREGERVLKGYKRLEEWYDPRMTCPERVYDEALGIGSLHDLDVRRLRLR